MPNAPITSKSRQRIAVRSSQVHGRGVFSLARIRKGDRVIEYKGERISHREADERYEEEHQESPHTMLFTVDDQVVIDGTRRGNAARWINHSCVPNCEAVDEGGRIFIVALRDIRPGEELSYDYNLQLDEPHTAAAKRRYKCACGSRRCRGTLLGPKE